MANVDFSKRKDGSGSAPVTVETTVQPVNTPAGDKVDCVNSAAYFPPARQNTNDLGLTGHVPKFSEIIIPRINLVANTGRLKDTFSPGSLIFNQSLVLHTAAEIKDQVLVKPASSPVVVTVIDFRPTRFVEKIQGGSGRGKICYTEEEVVRAGGTLDYQEYEAKKASGMKRFEYLADALVLIERPESVKDDDTIFVYEVNGKKYALALYGMKGAAYTVAKRALFTPRTTGFLRGGYPTYSVLLSSETAVWSGNTYWRPVIKPGTKSTPEMIDFIKSIISAPVKDSDDNGE